MAQELSALSISRRDRGISKTPIGRTYGRLTVVACDGYRATNTHPRERLYWRCRCECGIERSFCAQSVKRGGSKSCGCFARDRASELCRGRVSPSRKEFGEANRNMVLMYYRNRAKRLGRQFTLSRDEFFDLIAAPCFYCGAPPSNRMNWKGCYGTCIYSGVDRADNSIGYVPGNCVPCCAACNRSKNTMSSAQFIALAQRIAVLHPVGRARVDDSVPGR